MKRGSGFFMAASLSGTIDTQEVCSKDSSGLGFYWCGVY
jgi:hypothetical protein